MPKFYLMSEVNEVFANLGVVSVAVRRYGLAHGLMELWLSSGHPFNVVGVLMLNGVSYYCGRMQSLCS